MSNAIGNIEKRQEIWAENPGEVDPPEVSPALVSVITKFLHDNKITCAPVDSGAVSELEQRLNAKKERRRVGNVTHLHPDE